MSTIAILVTHFGFAGALGALIYQARRQPDSVYTQGVFAFGSLVFLPSSLLLPFTSWLRYTAWFIAIAIALVFSFRPARLPAWLWSPLFAYRYLVVVMLAILVWSAGEGLSPTLFSLGSFAALASGLAWNRSCQRV